MRHRKKSMLTKHGFLCQCSDKKIIMPTLVPIFRIYNNIIKKLHQEDDSLKVSHGRGPTMAHGSFTNYHKRSIRDDI